MLDLILMLILCRNKFYLVALQQDERFERLDSAVKQMIEDLAQNQKAYADRLAAQSISIKDLVSASETAIISRINGVRDELLGEMRTKRPASPDDTSHKRKCVSQSWSHAVMRDDCLVTERSLVSDREELKQNTILQHLRFPTMQERYETVAEAHAATFEWVFDEVAAEHGGWNDMQTGCVGRKVSIGSIVKQDPGSRLY